MRIAIALLALLLTAQGAASEEELTAAERAVLKQANQTIVDSGKDTKGVFSVGGDGSIKHLQSGVVCPAKLPNAAFYAAFVYDGGKGFDVGCDYRRPDDKGGANAKLTVFAVKAEPGDTADSAFAAYRGGLVKAMPEAKSLGEALHDKTPDSVEKKLPPFRSEEFTIPLNGKVYTTQLYVALDQGWIIEVRATFVGLPNEIRLDNKDTAKQDAFDAAGDRAMGPVALLSALGTLAPPPSAAP